MMLSKEEIKEGLIIGATKPDGSMVVDMDRIDELTSELFNDQLECNIKIHKDSISKLIGFARTDKGIKERMLKDETLTNIS